MQVLVEYWTKPDSMSEGNIVRNKGDRVDFFKHCVCVYYCATVIHEAQICCSYEEIHNCICKLCKLCGCEAVKRIDTTLMSLN